MVGALFLDCLILLYLSSCSKALQPTDTNNHLLMLPEEQAPSIQGTEPVVAVACMLSAGVANVSDDHPGNSR